MTSEQQKLTPAKRMGRPKTPGLLGKLSSGSRLRKQLNTQRRSSKAYVENNKILTVELEKARTEIKELAKSNVNLQKELLECLALNYRYEQILKGDMQYNAIGNNIRLVCSNDFLGVLNCVKASLLSVLDDKLKEISTNVEVLAQQERLFNQSIFPNMRERYSGNTLFNVHPSRCTGADSSGSLGVGSHRSKVQESNKVEREVLKSVENTFHGDAEAVIANQWNQVEANCKRKPKSSQGSRENDSLVDLSIPLIDPAEIFNMVGLGVAIEQEKSNFGVGSEQESGLCYSSAQAVAQSDVVIVDSNAKQRDMALNETFTLGTLDQTSHLKNVSQHECSQSAVVAGVSDLSLRERVNKTENTDSDRRDKIEQSAESEKPEKSSNDSATPEKKIRKQKPVKTKASAQRRGRRSRRQKLSERKQNAQAINERRTAVRSDIHADNSSTPLEISASESAHAEPTSRNRSNTRTLPSESETKQNVPIKITRSKSRPRRSQRLRRQSQICYKEPSSKAKMRRQ